MLKLWLVSKQGQLDFDFVRLVRTNGFELIPSAEGMVQSSGPLYEHKKMSLFLPISYNCYENGLK